MVDNQAVSPGEHAELQREGHRIARKQALRPWIYSELVKKHR